MRRTRDPQKISIHALCEEGDGSGCEQSQKQCYFYPRPLRGGRRFIIASTVSLSIFLSTPSARRATAPFPRTLDRQRISIHALCEEGDPWRWLLVTFTVKFLSTPSARRATVFLRHELDNWQISIHALREEGDLLSHNFVLLCTISIHALREEGDLDRLHKALNNMAFLSTPSARRATVSFAVTALYHAISIHALREEGDPAGNAPATRKKISIHALREEGDCRRDPLPGESQRFLSTPSARRATFRRSG